MSHEVYRNAARAVSSPRENEYRAFGEATRRLLEASKKGRGDLKALVEAVHMNRELWIALALDCADARNALPQETKRGIVALARWVGDYSSLAVRKGESLEPLIDVNRIVMQGLAAQPA